MLIAVTLVVTGIACFLVGWLIAEGISNKRFNSRQNYMEKLNRKF